MFASRLLFPISFSLALATCAPAQEEEPTAELPPIAQQALESDLAYTLVSDLVTTIGARFAGSENEAAARAWAVARFEELGFQNIHVEPFEVPGWRRGREEGFLLTSQRQHIELSTLGGSPATPEGGLRAPLAFVATHDDLLAAPPGAYDGMIVFINDHMERTESGQGYRGAVRKRKFGAIEAARRGAVAVLSRSVNTSPHRFASAGGQWFEDGVEPIPAAAVSNPDANRIERLARDGAPLEVELFIEPQDLEPQLSGNVIAEIPGATRPEEIVLLGAHLDTWDNTDGALDDGAGVATVMSAAWLVSQQETPPDRTIRVVLFGAEEIGALGGFAYANRHGPAFTDIAAAIEQGANGMRAWEMTTQELSALEGFARGHNSAPYYSAYTVAVEADAGGGAPLTFNTNVHDEDLPFYDRIGEQLASLGVTRGTNDSGSGADIYTFRQTGANVVDIKQDMSDYFDVYHTSSDTLSQVDPEALQMTVAAYAVFAQSAATLPRE